MIWIKLNFDVWASFKYYLSLFRKLIWRNRIATIQNGVKRKKRLFYKKKKPVSKTSEAGFFSGVTI
jgi:hypothetical protein